MILTTASSINAVCVFILEAVVKNKKTDPNRGASVTRDSRPFGAPKKNNTFFRSREPFKKRQNLRSSPNHQKSQSFAPGVPRNHFGSILGSIRASISHNFRYHFRDGSFMRNPHGVYTRARFSRLRPPQNDIFGMLFQIFFQTVFRSPSQAPF